MTRRKPNGAAPAPEAKRCAIYTRKSTEEGLDQEFNTLDAQRESGEAFIVSQRHLGWECLPEHYDDGGFTGANIERPAMRRLLADIEQGKVDVVLVYKVDRLSRSLLDFARLMEVFERREVSFVSVTQQFNTASSMGRLVLNVLLSFAQFEREMIAERTRDKIAASRRKGKWTGGSVPLGYQVQNKKLVIDDLEGLIVREIFDLYEQHRSALAVARALNEAGCRTKRHRANNGNVRGAREWCKDAVLRVLKNPIFAGYIPYGDDLYEGEHQALIDRERWRGVRAALDGRRKASRNRLRNPEYILRGILRCARCGYTMTPASTRKGGRTYRYYRCVTRDKKGRHACPAKPLPADAIESFVVERIREATADGGLAADVAQRLHARAARQRKGLLTERAELPKKIAALAAEIRKLVNTLAEVNGTAQRLVDERIEQVNEQLTLRESRLAEVERALAAVGEADLEIDWVADTLARFDTVWDALTAENRGRLARCLVERVEVDESSGQVTAVLVDLGFGGDGDDHDHPPDRTEHLPALQVPCTPSMEANP